MQTLEIKPRTKKDTIGSLKKEGRIPAVFYGPKEKSTSISISVKDFIKVWKVAGETSVVVLKDTANNVEHETLIHDHDAHPVSGAPRHIDFYVLEKGKKVQVNIPITFTGISPAVKDKGGILVKVAREAKIEAAPKDLPHELVVDISPLVELNSVLHARDLVLPTGVTLIMPEDEIIASISVAKEEAVDAPTTIDVSTIEVAEKGKKPKEGEEATGVAPAGDKGGDAKKK